MIQLSNCSTKYGTVSARNSTVFTASILKLFCPSEINKSSLRIQAYFLQEFYCSAPQTVTRHCTLMFPFPCLSWFTELSYLDVASLGGCLWEVEQ